MRLGRPRTFASSIETPYWRWRTSWPTVCSDTRNAPAREVQPSAGQPVRPSSRTCRQEIGWATFLGLPEVGSYAETMFWRGSGELPLSGTRHSLAPSCERDAGGEVSPAE